MSARILVVDDEEIVIRSCLRILGGDDFQVEAVQDGQGYVPVTVGAFDPGRVENDVAPDFVRRDGRRRGVTHPGLLGRSGGVSLAPLNETLAQPVKLLRIHPQRIDAATENRLAVSIASPSRAS